LDGATKSDAAASLKLMQILLLLLLFSMFVCRAQDVRELIRLSGRNFYNQYKQIATMPHERDVTLREFDSAGKVIEQKLETIRFEDLGGIVVPRKVSENGQPLSGSVKQDVDEKWRKQAEELRRLSPDARVKKQGERVRQWDFVKEFPDAFDFTYSKDESWQGRNASVYDFKPRPGYQPKQMYSKVFLKMKGKIWVDAAEKQWLRVDATMFDDVTLGGFLAKIEKGTNWSIEQRRSGEGKWQPKLQRMRYNARILLVKGLHRERVTMFR
jgi:hypothetical protein